VECERLSVINILNELMVAGVNRPINDGIFGCEGQTYSFNLQFFAQDPDKTEEATPRRKQEARKKGQAPRSNELSTVVVLLALFIILNSLGKWFYKEFITYIEQCLSPGELVTELNESNLGNLLFRHCLVFLRLFLPLGLGALIIGLVINLVQVGPMFSMEPLRPKFSKLNPINGLQRLFSAHGFLELAKSIIKLVIVFYFAYSTIREHLFMFLDMFRQSPFDVALALWRIIYQVAMKICMFLLALAIFDYIYQRWEFRKSLRMTKREVKDEFKQTEGNPQIKNKIRQRQREIAMRRMMQDVPKADVVITNPTHLAIALRYDSTKMTAPVVVAKGEGFIAQKIKEIAAANDVVLVENKPLAQAIYKSVDIGEGIPENLFQAVAEVLAYVYRLKRKHA
jgi:flagellar biosynthetic protein FlhB